MLTEADFLYFQISNLAKKKKKKEFLRRVKLHLFKRKGYMSLNHYYTKDNNFWEVESGVMWMRRD